MATPVNPSSGNDPHKIQQQLHAQPSALIKKARTETPNTQEFKQHTSMDPAGVWSRFLSGSGEAPSLQEVKGFLTGLEKMLQITVQQNARAAKRANDRLRETQDGG